jgi:hypothetical protein
MCFWYKALCFLGLCNNVKLRDFGALWGFCSEKDCILVFEYDMLVRYGSQITTTSFFLTQITTFLVVVQLSKLYQIIVSAQFIVIK